MSDLWTIFKFPLRIYNYEDILISQSETWKFVGQTKSFNNKN